MIQVQIASQVTPTGVQGTRWVLIDDAEEVDSATPASLLAATTAPVDQAAEHGLLSTGLLKTGVVIVGLSAAWWASQVLLGPPTMRLFPAAPAVGTETVSPPPAVPPPRLGAAPPVRAVNPSHLEAPLLAPPESPAGAASAAARPRITAALQ
jgi:hypothetical protein